MIFRKRSKSKHMLQSSHKPKLEKIYNCPYNCGAQQHVHLVTYALHIFQSPSDTYATAHKTINIIILNNSTIDWIIKTNLKWIISVSVYVRTHWIIIMWWISQKICLCVCLSDYYILRGKSRDWDGTNVNL